MRREVLNHELPIAMAHRGSGVLWPENTLVAFQGAVDLGYRYLETDLHATADGVLVALHDDTLDRTTDGTGPVWKHTLEHVQSLDAGYRFDAVHHFPHRGTGVRVPTLEEIVTTFPDALLTVDLKQNGLEPLLVDAVHRLDLWDRLIVGSFRDSRIRRFRRLTGARVATSTGPLATARAIMAARSRRPLRVQADALQIPMRRGSVEVVTPTLIEAAHAADKHVHVWTVNDPQDMVRLLDMGVDSIISDRVDTLKEVMISRGGGGPPEWHDDR